MIHRTSRTGAILAAALAAVGCGSSGGSYTPKPVETTKAEEIGAGDGPSLFPATVGNKWTYEVETAETSPTGTQQRTDEISFSVAKVDKVGNRTLVTLHTAINGEARDPQQWSLDSRGLFQEWLGTPANKFNPAQPHLLFPLQPGKNFSWKGTGPTAVGGSGNQTLNGTMYATQMVDTAMGRFSAISVYSEGNFTSKAQNRTIQGQLRTTTYWAKNIGLVRYRQDAVFSSGNAAGRVIQTLRLKMYTVK